SPQWMPAEPVQAAVVLLKLTVVSALIGFRLLQEFSASLPRSQAASAAATTPVSARLHRYRVPTDWVRQSAAGCLRRWVVDQALRLANSRRSSAHDRPTLAAASFAPARVAMVVVPAARPPVTPAAAVVERSA